jgi:16S rRNA (guanine966-N2)-methyltransferase
VLDLYAGSGALGIEALSRGAARAIFVEQDAAACKILCQNLRDMQRESRAQVVPRPVRQALSGLLAQGPFDLIFADPPYKSDELPWLMTQLAQHHALSPDGRLVLERASRDAEALASQPCPGLLLIDRRRYGDTSLLFYRPVGEAS